MSVEVDFDQPLLNVFGEPEGGRTPVRLGHVCSRALGSSWAADKRSDEQKDEDWRLAMKIGRSGAPRAAEEDELRFGIVRLDNKQASHLQDVVRAVFPGPAYCSQVGIMLEGTNSEGGKE